MGEEVKRECITYVVKLDDIHTHINTNKARESTGLGITLLDKLASCHRHLCVLALLTVHK